jgi:hypothetical protein
MYLSPQFLPIRISPAIQQRVALTLGRQNGPMLEKDPANLIVEETNTDLNSANYGFFRNPKSLQLNATSGSLPRKILSNSNHRTSVNGLDCFP